MRKSDSFYGEISPFINMNDDLADEVCEEDELERWKSILMRLSQSIFQMVKVLDHRNNEIDQSNFIKVWSAIYRHHTLSWDQFNRLKSMSVHLQHLLARCNEIFTQYQHCIWNLELPTCMKLKQSSLALDMLGDIEQQINLTLSDMEVFWVHVQQGQCPRRSSAEENKENVVKGTRWLTKLLQLYVYYGGDTPTTSDSVLSYLKLNWDKISDGDLYEISQIVESRFGNSSLHHIAMNFRDWIRMNYEGLPLTIRSVLKI